MKFQSLGSHYSWGWVLTQLFAVGHAQDSAALTSKLEQRYDGRAYLYTKGRSALSEAVRICVEPDSNVVAVNALTCSVVIEAIESAKATPHYLDIDPSTAHFDAETLKTALEQNPAITAVIVQNTYGRMCDIEAIEQIARSRNVMIIEDLAHSVGQVYPDGREAGTVGDLVMLSFGRDKLLDAVNGGALIMRAKQLMARVQPPSTSPSLLNQFRDRIYPMLVNTVRGLYGIGLGRILLRGMYATKLAVRSADGGIDSTSALPHWQAGLVLKRWRSLAELNSERAARMTDYEKLLGDALISQGGTIRAAMLVDDRADTLTQLLRAGYDLRDTWYDTPIGPARKFAVIAYPSESAPNAVAVAGRVINLPTHRCISSSDAAKIAEIVRAR